MAREIGEDGVFLTMVQSGAVDALPNATASSRLRPPLTLDANAHNKTVKAYFASAGLPVEQIEELSIQATMATEVRDSQEQKPVLEYYTTFIKRQIQGIQIPDSYASARINIDGDVVTESVHWPAIPQSAIDAALRIRTRLSDPEKAQAFKAKVGDKYGLNRVAVHHTPGEYPGATEAVAAFDVDENTKTFHFDENGDKIVLPQEVLVAPLGGASKK